MWWSWLLTAGGGIVVYLIGQKKSSAWLLGIALQGLWIAYALATKQYGFIVSSVMYGSLYGRNYVAWCEKKVEKTPDQGEWYARPEQTLRIWDHWYSLHWLILRALHVVDLEWNGSVVRACWFRRARRKGS